MFVYRIEMEEPSDSEQGYEVISCHTHSFASHEEADWWASQNPYFVTMTFLMEVERNEAGHLVEVV